MKRMVAGTLVVVTLMVLSGCGKGELSPAEIVEVAKQYNVVIVVLDAAGAKHFSCYGNPRQTTPYLDAVAREGVVFENAYAQASGTMLSVFSYFTSRYPYFAGDVEIGQDTALHISGSMTTMAEALAGRYPHRFGFTSNTWLRREFGHDQGFTEYHQLWDQSKTDLRRAARLGPTDVVMIPRALDFMRARAAEGFFAYLHFMPPHSPYRAPEPFFSRFTIGRPSPEIGERDFLHKLEGTTPPDTLARNIEALYEASLAFMDEAIGGMITEMKAAGIWDETIFILMSDHGEAFWEHPPFKGHGGIVYEEVVRVPLVVRIPGLPQLAGRRVSARVELVDLLPTLLELQGLSSRALRLAGRSLVPLMAAPGAAAPRTVHTQTNRRLPPIHAIIADDFKLIHHDGSGKSELFDLATDPAEQHDLVPAGTHGPVVEVLLGKLKQMRARGSEQGTVPHTVSTDSLDDATRARLRSLGYIR